MTLLKSVLRWGSIGLGVGIGVALADFLVTFTTHGDTFVSCKETYALLAIVSLVYVVPGFVVGCVAGIVPRLKETSGWWLPLLAFIIAGVPFFLLRTEEHVVQDGIDGTISKTAPRDVLWIVIDTLRADSLYGEDLSFPDAPNLGALARESVIFTEAEAPSGWTIPSVAGLLTGMHPATLGARNGLLPSGAMTIAELLRSAGWQTSAHIDNTLLRPSNGFAAGFDRFQKRVPMDFCWAMQAATFLPFDTRGGLRNIIPISYGGATRLIDGAIADLEASDDDPLFLYVHAMDVHEPYWSGFDDDALKQAAQGLSDMGTLGRWKARKRVNFLTPELRKTIRDLHNAELSHVDRELGRLIQRFGELRDFEDAIIVVTSDHGEEFWEHGMYGHGHALWGEVVRVPMFVRFPAGVLPEAGGLHYERPVSLIDVVPTVVDVLGLSLSDAAWEFEGRSLLPAMRGESISHVSLHSEQFTKNREIHRWREEDMVLVHGEFPDGREKVWLFDVRADPDEEHDLAPERSDDVARLRNALETHLRTISRGGSEFAGDAVPNTQGLRDLGY